MFENVILVDYDGVCGYWEHSFDMWMRFKGYDKKTEEYDIHLSYGIPIETSELLISMFNESAHIEKLPPFKDAIKYICLLYTSPSPRDS